MGSISDSFVLYGAFCLSLCSPAGFAGLSTRAHLFPDGFRTQPTALIGFRTQPPEGPPHPPTILGCFFIVSARLDWLWLLAPGFFAPCGAANPNYAHYFGVIIYQSMLLTKLEYHMLSPWFRTIQVMRNDGL